jgi:hypothetical protein
VRERQERQESEGSWLERMQAVSGGRLEAFGKAFLCTM